jgi:hypothetical protein
MRIAATALLSEEHVNEDLVGRRMINRRSGLIGEYIASVRAADGAHWVHLRLVAQGHGTGFRLGGTYMLRAETLRLLARNDSTF